MLESLRNFLNELAGGTKQQDHFGDDDYRLAAGALLIHVCSADGDMSAVEREKLHAVLKHRFSLDDAATAELIDAATAADRNAVDLYHFTSLINRSLNEEGRRRVVEMMWELVYAGGRITGFQENVVWRASDLMGISSRERIEIKHQVAAGPRGVPGEA
jgi:uncharacterized tellurite resistance protein B-like protein